MSVPTPIARSLIETGGIDLPGRVLAEHAACAGAKFHSPSPLTLREIAFGTESVWLCGTCSDNLLVLLGMLKSRDGDLAWETRRCFGNLLRAIGLRVYRAQEEPSV